MSRKFLGRRTFLRGSVGLGAAVVGVPLLEAMLNENGTALADGNALPMQFTVWFMGNGYRLEKLEPSTTGLDFELTPQLLPFANVQEYLSIATGLQNWCAQQITHHEGMTAFTGYTMVEIQGLSSKAGGPTIDQVVADYIAANAAVAPPIRSVQLGVSKKTSIMDQGSSLFAVSHRGPNEDLRPKYNPQDAFNYLFGSFMPKADDHELRISVLDAVRADSKKLSSRLGSKDKERLESHLDGLNELEKKINALPPACELPGIPTETNPDNPPQGKEPLTSVNEAMSDLLVYAYSCDITRVGSVMFIGGAAETTYTEIDQTVGHHYNTHDDNAQNKVNDGVVYAHEKLAYLLDKMKATKDPMGKNLLDTGLVLSGSDCSVGLTHSVSRQPYILVGALRDRMKVKNHYQAVARSGSDYDLKAAGNTSDVLFTINKAFDKSATSFGDMSSSQLQGGWYGGNNVNSHTAGSNTVIDDLKGPDFDK